MFDDRVGSNRRRAPWAAAAHGAVAVAVAWLFCRQTGVYVDDAYITLTYAKNLALGNGMVFQAGERVFGTTTPLWCWLNAIAMWLHPAALKSGAGCHLLSWGASAWAALAIFRVLRAACCETAAAGAGAVLWLAMPAHLFLFGMEYSLATALAAELALAFVARRVWRAGALATALCLTRPEATILPLALGVFAWVRWSRADFLRFAAVPVAVGTVALGGFWWYFGSPVPGTFAAKRAQFANEAAIAGAPRIFGLAWDFLRGQFAPLPAFLLGTAIPLAALFRSLRGDRRGAVAVRRAGAATILLLWAGAHLLTLALLRLRAYDWYLAPLWLAFAIGCGLGIRMIGDFLHRRARGRLPAEIATGLLAVAVVAPAVHWYSAHRPEVQRARFEGYEDVAQRMHTKLRGRPATVLAMEVGVLGFYKPDSLRVMDEWLLVTGSPDPSGRMVSREEWVRLRRPDFLLEQHPQAPLPPPEVLAFQNLRLLPEFYLAYEDGVGGRRIYRRLFCIRSAFGLQAMLEYSESVPGS